MRLISRVEIAYFRSIYKERLDDLLDTNILFGRNDAGKSNVLRALNLFFNNETNPGQVLDFDRDFCHARRAEADPTRNIRKFVYVKIWFATPPSYRPSLGPEFWVKKQWSVTREADPILDSSIDESRMQQYLTRLLNKIQFHYIPAIKDRRIFEHLLGQIYRVVASHEAFSESLSEFAGALRDRTSELTHGLLKGLGIDSVISPPGDLTDLFRSLDFETNTESGDSYSLTLQRGDGIQMRHIPAILAFISDRSAADYHVWGFEEPENSLELTNAIDEAKVFCRYGSDGNKQVFLTSHSPAFFALADPSASRFFVSRTEEHGERRTSKLKPIMAGSDESPAELMGETPHLPVISDYLRVAHGRIEVLQDEGDRLAQLLRDRDRSILFVEGTSDARVLIAAWDALIGVQLPCDVEPAKGTKRMESLARDGRVIDRLAPGRTVLALVDNDRAGREVYTNGKLGRGGRWVRHNSNGVYWCRLPFGSGFEAAMTAAGIPESDWPGSLETLFPAALRDEAVADGALILDSTPHDELLDSQWFPAIQAFLPPSTAPERHFVLKVAPDSKVPFAEWIAARVALDPTIVESLRPVLEEIHRILIGPLGHEPAEA